MRPLAEVAAELGLTGRKVHYWTQTTGWVDAIYLDGDGNRVEGGSGTRAMVSAEQELRMHWMVKLIAAGFEPAAASTIGLQLAQGKRGVELSSELLLIREGGR